MLTGGAKAWGGYAIPPSCVGLHAGLNFNNLGLFVTSHMFCINLYCKCVIIVGISKNTLNNIYYNAVCKTCRIKLRKITDRILR